MGSASPALRARCWDSASRSAARRRSAPSTRRASAWLACEGRKMIYSEQHRELMRSVKKFCETEINPHVDEWEQASIFPAHEIFKKMGNQGFLGIHKPETFGGLGLDYSYEVAFCEALGACKSASITMAVGVHTDMATPALTRHGPNHPPPAAPRPLLSPHHLS